MQRISSLIFFTALLFPAMSCQSSSSDQTEDGGTPNGQKIFTTHCRLCHGADGRLGLNGATNLAESELTKTEVVQVVTHGRKMMQPFEPLLSETEIEAVSAYLLTLRNEP